MQAGKRYTLFQTLNWTRTYILIFIIYDSIPITLYYFFPSDWLSIPWQPISLIGIAVAFYLGFKNNSAYERLWEARKIWGGIVNASRSFTIMVRDYINNEYTIENKSDDDLQKIRKRVVHRHVAWLYALAIQLRKLKAWEHNSQSDLNFRTKMNVQYSESQFVTLKPYISEQEYDYILSKGNRASHLISTQSQDLIQLKKEGVLEHFRQMKMQDMLTELYTLQGKAERIKNFPFPRQYATVNYIFTVLLIALLPFGMISAFNAAGDSCSIWLAIPFSVIGSWVFWTMEMIGDYSENPFEGLYNDVPISSMARGIEIDIRQMLEETDLPAPIKPTDDSYKMLM